MLARLGETVQRAHKLGVKIVTGGDTSYGPNSLTRIAQEVANFVELGMSPLHALQAATITAAEMLRIDGRTGAILSGREADLMAVERNPLDDPRVLQDALLVISNGQVAVNRLDMEKKGPGTE
jgi:imidazolonepropionase-like amidohydrolase